MAKTAETVDELMARRSHPLAAEIDALRTIIRNATPAIAERVKWNGPSYYLAANPKLLMLDEPTRGIDVGARFEIEQLIQQLAKEGTSFLLVSSELDELIRTCSRIFVMRDRTTAAELTGIQISEEAIMSAMAGGQE